MTSAKAVIATIAEDRPGLVSDLSAIVTGLGLNIEDSRMTVLGGEFAVLMSVAGDDAALESLDTQLQNQAAAGGFAFLYRRTSDRPRTQQHLFAVTVAAMDHPGIVSRVTGFFSDRSVNIRELSTDTERAAHTGAPVFNLTMEVEITDQDGTGPLLEAFDAFCAQEGLDGKLIAL